MTSMTTDFETAAATRMLPADAQRLVNARLDTLDRMLLGRVPRGDRLEIVREVQTQILDTIAARHGGLPTREDLLALLRELDPPEAYLPEDADAPSQEHPRAGARPRPSPATPSADRGQSLSRLSGVIGLVGIGLLFLLPGAFLVARSWEIDLIIFLEALFFTFGLFGTGVAAIVLAACSRMKTVWAMVGLSTGVISLLASVLLGIYTLVMTVGL